MTIERDGERFRLRINAQNAITVAELNGETISIPKGTGAEVLTEWLPKTATASELQAAVDRAFERKTP